MSMSITKSDKFPIMSYKKRTQKIVATCKMASTTNLGGESPNTRIMPEILTKCKTQDGDEQEIDSIMTQCIDKPPDTSMEIEASAFQSEKVPDAADNTVPGNNEQNKALELSQPNVNSTLPECVIEASKAVDGHFQNIEAQTKIPNSAKNSTEEKERDELPVVEDKKMGNNDPLSERSEIRSASLSNNDSSSTSKTCSRSSCSGCGTSSSSDNGTEPFDSDDSIKDPPYHESSSDESSSDDEALAEAEEKENIPKKRKVVDKSFIEKKVKKRSRNPQAWQKNFNKRLRNSGESYIGLSTRNDGGTKKKVKTQRPQKTLQPPCGQKCKLKCFE